MPLAPIEFYFDFSSPYAYIASEWIDAVAARHGRTVDWHAILLGATFAVAELKSPVAHPLKREYSLRDFERSARHAGVLFRLPAVFPIATQNVARLFWWLKAGGAGASGQLKSPAIAPIGTAAMPSVVKAVNAVNAVAPAGLCAAESSAVHWARHCFRAYFIRGVNLNEPTALRALAAEFGIDPNEAEAVWSDPHWKNRLRAANDAAIERGVFGAPFFIIDGEPFWGNDRQVQIEHWLEKGSF